MGTTAVWGAVYWHPRSDGRRCRAAAWASACARRLSAPHGGPAPPRPDPIRLAVAARRRRRRDLSQEIERRPGEVSARAAVNCGGQPFHRRGGVDGHQRGSRHPHRASPKRASIASFAPTSTTAASGLGSSACPPAASASSASPRTTMAGSRRASRTKSSRAAASAGSVAASSSFTPAKALRTRSPRVRARRNPANRLMCARRSASTSGSGRGNTAAASRAKAWPPRTGSPSLMSTGSLNGRSSREAASGSGRCPVRRLGARWGNGGSPGRTTRRPAVPARRTGNPTPARIPRSSARRRCGCVRGGRRARPGSAPVRRARRCEGLPAARAGHRSLASSSTEVYSMSPPWAGNPFSVPRTRRGGGGSGSGLSNNQVHLGLVRVKIDLT